MNYHNWCFKLDIAITHFKSPTDRRDEFYIASESLVSYLQSLRLLTHCTPASSQAL